MRINGTTLLLLAIGGFALWYFFGRKDLAVAAPQDQRPDGGEQNDAPDDLFSECLALLQTGLNTATKIVQAQTTQKTN